MPTPPPAAPRHLPGLDGVRALAVVAVVWHHAHPGYGWWPGSHNGFLGVDLFFVLSGLLITTLLLHEQDRHGRISLKHFYIRRSLRIFPLYYALLAGMALYFVQASPSPLRHDFLTALPFHLTYLSNWVQPDSLMAITWSLSTEEQFYLVWPPLLVLLGPRRSLPVLLGFLLLNQAVNFGWLDGPLRAIGLPYESRDILQATFTPILLGVLLAFGLHASAMPGALARALGPPQPWMLWVPTAALLLLANWPGDMRGLPRLAFHLVATAWLGALVLNPQHAVVRGLQWRPLVYIGTVSYGVYLLHKPMLDVARRLLHRLAIDSPEALFALGLLLTMVVAGLSYRYFESPLLRLKDRFRENDRVVNSPAPTTR